MTELSNDSFQLFGDGKVTIHTFSVFIEGVNRIRTDHFIKHNM